MDVLVERYQRRKYVNQEDAPMLYYIRQKAGNVRVRMSIQWLPPLKASVAYGRGCEAYH